MSRGGTPTGAGQLGPNPGGTQHGMQIPDVHRLNRVVLRGEAQPPPPGGNAYHILHQNRQK